MSRTSSGLARLLGSPWAWLAVGLIVRVFHVATLGNRYYSATPPSTRSPRCGCASGSLEGNSVRAPVAYPAVLALRPGSRRAELCRGASSSSRSRLCTCCWGCGWRLASAGRAAGVVAAPALALAPSFVFVAGLLYPTLLYSTVVLGMTYVAWDLAERPRTSRAVLLGVLIAIGWLTDMVILAPTCAVLGWLVIFARRQPAALARTLGIAGLVAAVLTVPFLAQVTGGMKSRAFMSKAQAVLHFARTDTLISRGRWIRMPFGTPFAALPPREFAARELGPDAPEPVIHARLRSSWSTSSSPFPTASRPRTGSTRRSSCGWAGWFSLVLSLSSRDSCEGTPRGVAACCWLRWCSQRRRSTRCSSPRRATASPSSPKWWCSGVRRSRTCSRIHPAARRCRGPTCAGTRRMRLAPGIGRRHHVRAGSRGLFARNVGRCGRDRGWECPRAWRSPACCSPALRRSRAGRWALRCHRSRRVWPAGRSSSGQPVATAAKLVGVGSWLLFAGARRAPWRAQPLAPEDALSADRRAWV